MKATLTATLERSGERTVPSSIRTEPPLAANWSTGPRGEMALYISNLAGQALGGDEYQQHFRVGSGAHAVVTTVSAPKVGHGRGACTVERTHLAVDANGVLEWVPDPQILFSEADLDQETHVDLDPNSTLIYLAAQSVGRIASGERHRYRRWRQQLEIRVGGKPSLMESWDLWPAGREESIETLLEGFNYLGTGYFSRGGKDVSSGFRQAVAAALQGESDDTTGTRWIAGHSLSPAGGLLVRWLASSAADSAALSTRLWATAREGLLGSAPFSLGKH